MTCLHPEHHSALVLHKASHVYHPACKPFGPSYPENQGWSWLESSTLSSPLCTLSLAMKQGHSARKASDFVTCCVGAKAAGNGVLNLRSLKLIKHDGVCLQLCFQLPFTTCSQETACSGSCSTLHFPLESHTVFGSRKALSVHRRPERSQQHYLFSMQMFSHNFKVLGK